MKEKIKLIIILLLAAILAVSVFFGFQTYSAKKITEQERDGLKSENETLNRKMEEVIQERKQLQGRVNALTSDLDKISQERQEIQKQHDLIVKQKDELVGKLEALRRSNEELRENINAISLEKQKLGQRLGESLAGLKSESSELKKQLEDANVIKNKLESELGQVKGEKSDIERKINVIELFLEQKLSKAERQELKEQLEASRSSTTPEIPATPLPGEVAAPEEAANPKKLAPPEKESVELPPIVVRPQAQVQAEVPLEEETSAPSIKPAGKVLEVNKEEKFVIVDLGENAGVKVGDTFKVYKQDEVIGTIEVIQVRQGISACDIKEEIKAIETGDDIVK